MILFIVGMLTFTAMGWQGKAMYDDMNKKDYVEDCVHDTTYDMENQDDVK